MLEPLRSSPGFGALPWRWNWPCAFAALQSKCIWFEFPCSFAGLCFWNWEVWLEVQKSGENAGKERLEFMVCGIAFFALYGDNVTGNRTPPREDSCCHMDAAVHTWLGIPVEYRLHCVFSKTVACISWHFIPVTFTLTKASGCYGNNQSLAKLETSCCHRHLGKSCPSEGQEPQDPKQVI